MILGKPGLSFCVSIKDKIAFKLFVYLFTTQPCKKEYPCLKVGKEHISNHINDPKAMDCDSDFFLKRIPLSERGKGAHFKPH